MLLNDSIKYWSSKTPMKTAIIAGDRYYTYNEVWSNINNFSSWIVSNTNIQDRIGILLENCPETVFAVYGVTKAGRICVPMDADIHKRNLKYIVNDCSIKTIITSSKILKRLTIVEDIIKNIVLVNGDDADLDFTKIISEENSVGEHIPCFENDVPAFILYTTGTTGPQKGVVLSHYNLLEATKNINEFMQIESDIVESLPMRLSHSFGFARLRSVFSVGGTVILENGFLRPEKVIFNMKKYFANAISSVPAGFVILLNYYQDSFKEISGNIKYIEIGSASMRLSHKEMLMELCPKARICMHYGLTEASRATFIEFHSNKEKLNTVGKASPNVQIKIVDEAGIDVGLNKQGNILVKGNMVTIEYFNKVNQTKQNIKNGWLNTGDLGIIDQEGHVHLLGRKKEIINVGGLKVAPGEVEQVLLKHQDILEVGVVGKPTDDLNMEAICAFIVTDNPEINLEGIQKFCKEELETYKLPNRISIVKSLPMTDSGKIKRHLLREIKD
jgi:long-chain acyl-CoA synthetase